MRRPCRRASRPSWNAIGTRLVGAPLGGSGTHQTRYVGPGGEVPPSHSRERRARYRITAIERQTPAIASAQQGLGWQLQVTNVPVAHLDVAQVTAAYRAGWHVEHDFHKLKERPVGLSPLFVWREDQLLGLTRLLTLALRLLTLIETQVACGLIADGASLTRLYEGQPTRATQRPTAARLLKALSRAEITLTEVRSPEHTEWYLTPLPPWLSQVLRYLKLPSGLYENLSDN